MVALARTIYRRRRLVLALTLAMVVAAGAFGGPVVGLLTSDDDFEDPGSAPQPSIDDDPLYE